MRDYYVERLKPFFGFRQDAIDKVAKRDTDQFDVERILAYRGDPEIRTYHYGVQCVACLFRSSG